MNLWRPCEFLLVGGCALLVMIGCSQPAPPKEEGSPSAEVIPPAETSLAPVRIDSAPKIVIDSRITRGQALAGNRFPKHVVARMELVDVEYLGFDGLTHRGQIVVDGRLSQEVKQIFHELRKARFPIKKVVPVAKYGWDDLRSMADNNTSGFNYRGQITPNGKSRILSKHATGRAIDLNPLLNPYVSANGKATSAYRPSVRGTLTRNSAATKIFLRRGWQWGGNWPGGKDYQHFVKP